jgi:hypothetical protein
VATGRYRATLHTWRIDPGASARVPFVPLLQRELDVRRGETCVIEAPGR